MKQLASTRVANATFGKEGSADGHDCPYHSIVIAHWGTGQKPRWSHWFICICQQQDPCWRPHVAARISHPRAVICPWLQPLLVSSIGLNDTNVCAKHKLLYFFLLLPCLTALLICTSDSLCWISATALVGSRLILY